MDSAAGAVVSLRQVDQRWELLCAGRPELVAVPNSYLGYLTDRNYSPRTVRTYGYGLVAFCRWAYGAGVDVEAVKTDDLLMFLSACRQQVVTGRGGPNVVDMTGRRLDRLAPSSVNLRVAAVAGMYEYLAMRDPGRISPIPKGRPSAWFAPGERTGLLAHTQRRPTPRLGCGCGRHVGCRGH